MFDELLYNVSHNLFKPLLLFFYMGFAIPLLRIKFEFPHVLYQGITMYLLIAIGWKGGEELAAISSSELTQAAGFMVVGFLTNTVIGLAAYFLLRKLTRLRQIDAATVAGYYGSDSAGTFVTCMGVLTSLKLAAEAAGNSELMAQYTPAPFMPVMLAVMEVPGCLVALGMIARLRQAGMDRHGYMPGEAGYQHADLATAAEEVEARAAVGVSTRQTRKAHGEEGAVATMTEPAAPARAGHPPRGSDNGHHDGHDPHANAHPKFFSAKVMHEVFLNPGLYLLFGGIGIGFLARLQGAKITEDGDSLFVKLFQGLLCLFLLEMGITACKRLRDLRTAGWGFIAFGILVPNLFASFGILVAHLYSHATGQPLEIGTYVLFAVLCGAASYIAVPAVQRLAIPEASPTLPLAASLGLTFTYNVTIGISVYLELAKVITAAWPVVA